MKVLGRWSLASAMKLVIDVTYYGLLATAVLICSVALWLALTPDRAGRKVSLTIPVRYQLDPASHPFSTARQDVHGVSITESQGTLKVEGGSSIKRLALILGDVTGKGLPAALLMTSFVGSVRALLSAGLRGSELIAALNRHVCTNAAGGRFVTPFYGELDASSGDLTYVNAGHNPPFLLRANGTVERLEPTTMVLGVTADAVVEARRALIGPDERLLLFTDGLSEAFDRKDEEYGDERVRESFRRASTLPPRAAVERLVADVQGFCGSVPLRDDMTLMLVAREPA